MKFKTKSYWVSTTPKTRYSSLKGDLFVDVAVIGAGMTGLTSALLLKEAGKKVAVIDQSHTATGESGRTTAHLTEVIDTRYSSISSDFGIEGARLVAESSRTAIKKIEEFINRFEISCDFMRVPAFLYSTSRRDVSELKKELSHAQSAGVLAAWTQEVPLPFKTYGAICVSNQAQFHPRKYFIALAQRIPGNGSHLFEKTRALSIEEGDPCRIVTQNGVISCREVIVATNTPISNRYLMHTKIAAYRTYALAAQVGRPPSQAALYWDNEDPYHYIRSHDGVWIIGGEDHKTGMKENTEEAFAGLEEFTYSNFGLNSTTHYWSGQIMEPVDGLPFIGRNPRSDHLFIATGFSGNGMTFGTISGMLLSDLILRKKNRWADIYRPNRIKPLASGTTFVSENKDYPLCLVMDRIRGSEVSSVLEIKRGEGKILKENGKSFAVSRDEGGQIHRVSAVCTHLGCLVRWNSAEQSWDCPCHGSRFTREGEVIHGPAIQGLSQAQVITQRRQKRVA